MNRIFSIHGGFKVPDGTVVYPFLNAKDSTSGLPPDLLDGFSIAAGDIGPYTASKIHVMPHVTQVTFVICGDLQIIMKDPRVDEAYQCDLGTQQAVLTQPGTFFQLVNSTAVLARVLYIVSPAYVFEMDSNKNVQYDDAIVLQESWDELSRLNWNPPNLRDSLHSREARHVASDRIQRRIIRGSSVSEESCGTPRKNEQAPLEKM